MEEYLMAAMLLVIFGGVPIFAFGMLVYMGIKRASTPVLGLFRK